MTKRRLRNAFNKYKKKAAEVKRLEYISSKKEWFEQIRNKKTLTNSIDAWKSYVARY